MVKNLFKDKGEIKVDYKHLKEARSKVFVISKKSKAPENKPKQSVKEKPCKIMVFDKITNRYVDKNQ